MKKRLIIMICIFVALLIAIGVFFQTPFIKTRLYFGDRITGSLSMTVAGKPYNPAEETLEYENQGTQRLKDDSAGNFSIKGGKYGGYKIGYILENKELYKLTQDAKFESYESDQTLTFLYINANWWHVTEMTLTADMVLLGDQWVINCTVVYKESTEGGSYTENTVQKSFTYDEVIAGNGIIQFGL